MRRKRRGEVVNVIEREERQMRRPQTTYDDEKKCRDNDTVKVRLGFGERTTW